VDTSASGWGGKGENYESQTTRPGGANTNIHISKNNDEVPKNGAEAVVDEGEKRKEQNDKAE